MTLDLREMTSRHSLDSLRRMAGVGCLACVALVMVVGSARSPMAVAQTTPTGAVPAGAYARAELLIEAAELKAARAGNGKRLVLDARTAEKFQESHLKDAINVSGVDLAKDYGDGLDPAATNRRLGQLGIDRDTEVIVYDDRAGQDGARIWWYLKYWDLPHARLVNGGWKAIQAVGLPTEAGAGRTPTPGTYASKSNDLRRIDLATLVTAHRAGRVGTKQSDAIQVIDARTEKEYRGEQKTGGERTGTIPGARHLEWADLVDPGTGRFRSTSEVGTLFQKLQIRTDQPIVVFSNSRGRSTSLIFALELAGAAKAQVLDAGFKSWASDADNPVETQAQ